MNENRDDGQSGRAGAWRWIPTLYFAEGLPYILIVTVSVIMYKKLGISNTEIALYTSWLYLPWVIKPFWSPIVDSVRTKRFWILVMQVLIGGGLAGVALTLPLSSFFSYSLAFLWLMAFSSATHDISADGFYMLALSDNDQAFFVGIRSTFYRISVLAGQGGLVILAGYLEGQFEAIEHAWSITFFVAAAFMMGLAIFHAWVLPKPEADDSRSVDSLSEMIIEIRDTFASFFRKPLILKSVLFLLFYRFAEGQLAKIASPFLLDDPAVGGLGLSTAQVGVAYGTVGVLALVVGGILGGVAVSRHGLKFWLWPMVVAINLPNVVYIFLAFIDGVSYSAVNIAVAIEQFGYGFGFTAFMMYMIYVADGEHKTSHFAICTGIMALGMMIPGMVSGWIQESIGYQMFFIWILIATIPGFVVAGLIRIDPSFGKGSE